MIFAHNDFWPLLWGRPVPVPEQGEVDRVTKWVEKVTKRDEQGEVDKEMTKRDERLSNEFCWNWTQFTQPPISQLGLVLKCSLCSELQEEATQHNSRNLEVAAYPRLLTSLLNMIHTLCLIWHRQCVWYTQFVWYYVDNLSKARWTQCTHFPSPPLYK